MDVGWQGRGTWLLGDRSPAKGYGIVVGETAELPRSLRTFGRRLVEKLPRLAVDAAERLREHLAGAGSPLVKVAHDRSLQPEIVAAWPGSKQTERAMKRRHRLAHYYPRCVTRAVGGLKGWPVLPR